MSLERMLRGAVLLAGITAAVGCSGGNGGTNLNNNTPVAWCGDGILGGNEQCDGAQPSGVTCADLGFDSGTLGCSAQCTHDTSGCQTADLCGDGARQPPEECDYLDLDGQTCESLGRSGGTLTCRADCSFDLSQCDRCGDGVMDVGEECDDGAANSDTAADACRADCRLSHCGDGVQDTGEACDGNAPQTTSCQDAGFDGGALICDAQCVVSTVGCTTCGNNTCEIGEALHCVSDCTLAHIRAASTFSCAHKSDGTVWCWGRNNFGMLGDGLAHQNCAPPGDPPEDCSPTPVPVSALSGVALLQSVAYHSLVVTDDGTIRAWGANHYGQLGTGTTEDSFTTPVQIPALANIATIGSHGDHTCAAETDGTLWCWGHNNYGQLGTGNTTDQPTPQLVAGLLDVVDISTGYEHTCAVRSDGAAFCWGHGYLGQTGNGTIQGGSSPVQVVGLPPVVSVGVGYQHSCALESSGLVWCWGHDQYGQLGTGSLSYTCPQSTNNCSLVPVRLDSLSGVARLAVGTDSSSCALKWDGTVWCWGKNWAGQLGDGTLIEQPLPVQAVGLTDIVSISVGNGHACAVDSSNQGWCWGQNYRGELGDGTQTDSLAPVAVQGL